LRIVLMGPPGAGKGTQAKKLAEKFGMVHLSSGDILRAERASGSRLGKRLAAHMDAGELVPDEIVVEVMAKAIIAGDSDKGLVLDGFPRTVRQAEALDAQLERAGKALDAVVMIDADDDLIAQRITGRRSCPECGKVYHVKFMPPRRDEVCDVCGAELIQREDDSESVVRQRLEAYKSQTTLVNRYYRDCGHVKVIDVDGNRPAEKTAASIADGLDAIRSGT